VLTGACSAATPGQPDPIFQAETLPPSFLARSRSFWDTSPRTFPRTAAGGKAGRLAARGNSGGQQIQRPES